MIDQKKLEHQLLHLDELQSACTNCGLCAEVCATFQASGWEQESPRGRIRLARDFLNGYIEPQSEALNTFDRCLACRACEMACPSHVQYGSLRAAVQEVRQQLGVNQKAAVSQKIYIKWIKMAARLGSWLYRTYGYRWIGWPIQMQKSYVFQHGQKQVDAIRIAVSCLQDVSQHGLIESATNVLNQLGYQVQFEKYQPCCGAILDRLVNGGQESIVYPKAHEEAKRLQKKRMAQFNVWLNAPTYFLSNDCKCFAKRTGQMEWIKDIHELIENELKIKKLRFSLPASQTIYYQPYCGSSKHVDPVLRLLQNIEGLTLKYVESPLACCGGYAQEAIWHPQHAQTLLEAKGFPEGATVVVTSADCYQQLMTHKQNHVVYLLEILAKAQLSNI
jgi:glycolate oxidase iron-sulfur subunit